MNTRIEAASYSGEGGQRFAGIADETGKLANQTNDIVQEADRAIRSVSNRMAETNRNMEDATQSLVKLTGIAFTGAGSARRRFCLKVFIHLSVTIIVKSVTDGVIRLRLVIRYAYRRLALTGCDSR